MSEIFNGQRIQYDASTNTILTSIRSPFYSAGQVLGWKEKIAGIGINNHIIAQIKMRRAHLRVKIDRTGDTYFITFENLDNVLDSLEDKANYMKKGIRLKVVPITSFIKGG